MAIKYLYPVVQSYMGFVEIKLISSHPKSLGKEILILLAWILKQLFCVQGCPENLRGPGQRVKVGSQGQGSFHSESHIHPSCMLKTKKKKRSLHVTALLEYLDLTAPLEYINLLNRYSRGPS